MHPRARAVTVYGIFKYIYTQLPLNTLRLASLFYLSTEIPECWYAMSYIEANYTVSLEGLSKFL